MQEKKDNLTKSIDEAKYETRCCLLESNIMNPIVEVGNENQVGFSVHLDDLHLFTCWIIFIYLIYYHHRRHYYYYFVKSFSPYSTYL